MNHTGPPGASSPQRPRRAPTMLLIGSITVTGILANTLLYPAIPNILADFGLDDGSAGVLVASASVPGILIAPLVGVLADRYGRRRVLVPCLVAFGCFGALGAFAPGFWWLILARLGQGVGAAGLINLANVLISDTWTGVERARRFGYNSAVLTLSLAVTPAVGGTLTDLGSWRFAFAPYPLALITALVAMARLDHGPTDRSTSIGAQVRAAARVARSVRVLAPLSLAFVTFIMIFGLMLTVLPLHLDRAFGLSAGERGLVMALPALGATTGALVLGWLRTRHSSRTVVIAAFVLFAAAYPAIGLAGTLLLLVPAGVVFGLGEGILLPTLTDVVAGSASETGRGAVLSLQVSAIRSGQTVGPLLAGVAVTAAGTGPTFLLGGGLAAVVVIVALVVQLPPPPPAVPVDDR